MAKQVNFKIGVDIFCPLLTPAMSDSFALENMSCCICIRVHAMRL